jgi:lysophospholipase L1-like esterase
MQPLYLATGNQAGTSGPFTTTYSCSMFVTSVDVAPPANLAGAVIALGDSITDGTGSTAGANHRYTDYLAQRFAALTGTTLSVTNAGIVGNAVLDNRFNSNGSINVNFGTPALARLGRDVLLQSGASAVLLLEGINDIGADDAQASDIALADEQIVIQAHAAGLKVYAGTLPPFGGSTVGYGGNYGTSAGEAQRQLLNQWIRTGNAFDGIVDFDQVLADPANPINLLAAYDSGDHLHPNDTGYQAMANAIDINGMIGQILASQ